MNRKGVKNQAFAAQLTSMLATKGLDVVQLEICSLPRPTGGEGLCVNFKVVPEPSSTVDALEAVTERIRSVLSYLVERRISLNYSGISSAPILHKRHRTIHTLPGGGDFLLNRNNFVSWNPVGIWASCPVWKNWLPRRNGGQIEVPIREMYMRNLYAESRLSYAPSSGVKTGWYWQGSVSSSLSL